MKRLTNAALLAAGILAGAGGTYWYLHRGANSAEPMEMSAAAAEERAGAKPERKVLYYRNPMGLPDTSPVPKKDSMGMDYIPVYADEGGDDGDTVSISPGKIQRSGVRTRSAFSRTRLRKLFGTPTPGIWMLDISSFKHP